MATFIVNGRTVTPPYNQKLIRYLRDVLHLTSVKDGCSQGACGACQIIVDGRLSKACILQTDRLNGATILTVEGLSSYEKDVYEYAFGSVGAVQCGFCTPSMVMAAKVCIDANPNPTHTEIARAIRTNICRCTGYVKIIEAITLAASMFRTNEVPPPAGTWSIGACVPRIDVSEKVRGTAQFPDDIYLDDMVYGSAVRSAYPRARIVALHTEEARSVPGVLAIYTAEDIPGKNKVGHLVKDWDTMIAVGSITHYLGDALCLVVAEDQATLEQAKELVKVDYEVLDPVRNPDEAQKEHAPLVHQSGNLLAHKHVERGDPLRMIERSPHVITQTFKTPWTEHAFLEPECAVAYPDGEGVMILSTDQGAYDTQHETMGMLGLPAELVNVQNQYVGGGFGGKEDVTVQHHAALIAYLLKRPVKVRLSRAESMIIHPKRHPMDMTCTLACDDDGIIQGMVAHVVADTGAYASLGGPVLERACTHASGPYHYHHCMIDGYAWYTNNPPAGAFRGFGVTQTCFAIESLLNQMAEKIGLSTWEIRYRNAIRPGQELPNGQIVDESTGLVETLEAIKPLYDANHHVGIACAMKNSGVGVGLPDTGRIRLLVQQSKVHILAGASCIGQGLGTVLVQMVCDQTPLTPLDIVYEKANTYNSPDSGTTSGSRQTLFTGEACRRACKQLNDALIHHTLEELEGQEFYAEYFGKTDKMGAPVPHPKSHIAYGYATQLCILNDDGTIKELVAAHDVGRAINPLSVEGQIEGGVIMSMGYTLTERYPLKDCRPVTKYGTLGLLRADQTPPVRSIIVEKAGLNVACGAIGIGEITSIPTAPAIAEAYYQLDGVRRRELPLTGTPYERKKKSVKAAKPTKPKQTIPVCTSPVQTR
ncbi:MAG: selenium-dependent xanthine dehydrogenase [Eggerthellaceae bacterium]|nr:selenium-dependent xanthine dehydrogenase [Eggerthellaceae bacterium]